jgi:hypothetical protein
VARTTGRVVVSWNTMSARVITASLAVAVTASSALLANAMPLAVAAPTSDGQGYINSTARCSTQDTTVVFGSTDASRVAICKTSGDGYEYRGVRVRDGARLIVPAKQSGDAFIAENGEVEYMVTAKSVVVSTGNKVIREEPMTDFHGAEAPAAPPPAPTSTAPLPPPLPAEEGGG